MKKHLLMTVTLLLLLCGVLSALPIMVVFSETVDKTAQTKTYSLIMQENPDYPAGFDKKNAPGRWIIQLYKDGGDDKISPLDENGMPTGDDEMITDSLLFNATQLLDLVVPYTLNLRLIRFFAKGEKGQAQQGDKVYLRIFNASSIEEATKYLVAHTLYSIPYDNVKLSYVPDYAWDKQGWITFRK